jgi:hypothetical protein
MKRVVITFGLISGAISSVMMIATLPFVDSIGFDTAEILGYTTIVLSFLMVFFGIRSYRDNVAGGTIGFVQAFKIGLLITLISCACYVVTWEILYFNFLPGFMDKMFAMMVEQVKASGAGPADIQTQLERMERFRELYRNPLMNAAITFLEPFPIGLVITAFSAAVLRRREPQEL